MAPPDRDPPEDSAAPGGPKGDGATTTRGRAIPPPSPSRRNVPVKIGDVIADKYVVEEVIGAGGVGVVVAARHQGLDERVAIKFLQRAAAETRENVARFDLEARALARVKSEHVARVMDVGRLATGESFMVMELLEGEDLAKVIARGPVPVADAVDHVVQACEAVAAAHDVAIVHRDLKPANLFVTRGREGRTTIKVLDFGISKLEGGPPELALTQTGVVLGTPLYMAPEQLRGLKDLDGRCDQYALACILYELVEGVGPHEGDTYAELAASKLKSAPRRFSARVPPPFVAAVMRALSTSPKDRFPDLASFAAALEPITTGVRFSDDADVSGLFPSAGPTNPTLDDVELSGATTTLERTVIRRPRALWFAVVAVVVIGLAIGWALRPSVTPSPTGHARSLAPTTSPSANPPNEASATASSAPILPNEPGASAPPTVATPNEADVAAEGPDEATAIEPTAAPVDAVDTTDPTPREPRRRHHRTGGVSLDDF